MVFTLRLAMQLDVVELIKTPVRSSRKAGPVHAVGYHNTTQQFLRQNVHQLVYCQLATSNIADSKLPTQINPKATFQSKMAFAQKNLSQMVVGKHFTLLSFRNRGFFTIIHETCINFQINIREQIKKYTLTSHCVLENLRVFFW